MGFDKKKIFVRHRKMRVSWLTFWRKASENQDHLLLMILLVVGGLFLGDVVHTVIILWDNPSLKPLLGLFAEIVLLILILWKFFEVVDEIRERG